MFDSDGEVDHVRLGLDGYLVSFQLTAIVCWKQCFDLT
jgi:hypothetical protein